MAPPCRADVDAVIGEGERGRERGERGVDQERPRQFAHLLALRDEVDEQPAAEPEACPDQCRHAEAPAERQVGRAPERSQVPRADGGAAERFGCGREAVEEVAADQEQVVQHCVRGQRGVAGPGALGCEEHISRQQQDGADEDVAVDRDGGDDPRPVEHAAPRRADLPPQRPSDEHEADQQRRGFAEQRADGRALDRPAKAEHEDQVQDDVGGVQKHLQQQAERGAALA